MSCLVLRSPLCQKKGLEINMPHTSDNRVVAVKHEVYVIWNVYREVGLSDSDRVDVLRPFEYIYGVAVVAFPLKYDTILTWTLHFL